MEHVTDRSFYGLRRILSDKANGYTTDDRVLNRMTGNTAETRKEYYLDMERDEDRAKAAEVRRRMRLDLMGAADAVQTVAEDTEVPEVPDVSVAEALGSLDPEWSEIIPKIPRNSSLPSTRTLTKPRDHRLKLGKKKVVSPS